MERDLVICESQLELARLLSADFDVSVGHIVAQPFLLKAEVAGAVRRHIPDYLMAERWQHHARAYGEGSAQFFGAPPPVGDGFIVLDLEYLTQPFGERVWLAGTVVAKGFGPALVHQVWADDTDADEQRLLEDLGRILDTHPQLPIVTWAGRGADLPRHAGPPRGSGRRTRSPAGSTATCTCGSKEHAAFRHPVSG